MPVVISRNNRKKSGPLRSFLNDLNRGDVIQLQRLFLEAKSIYMR